jgi:hypothetical protein
MKLFIMHLCPAVLNFSPVCLNTVRACVPKVPSVLNYTPSYYDVRGNGDIDPLIVNLGTRWKEMIRYTPRLLYPCVRTLGTNWMGRLVDLRALLDTAEGKTVAAPDRSRTAVPRSCGP